MKRRMKDSYMSPTTYALTHCMSSPDGRLKSIAPCTLGNNINYVMKSCSKCSLDE